MIVNKFEAAAKENKNRVAIKTGAEELTYGDLSRQSSRLGRRLDKLDKRRREWGEHEGNWTAGLLLEHGNKQVIGLLGVLKAGMIYVPLDTSYPRERLQYMVRDTAISIIVTDRENREQARALKESAGQPLEIIEIEQFETADIETADIETADIETADIETDNPEPSSPQPIRKQGEKGAYIIYTSGSTGKPKGVLQTDKNVVGSADRYIKAFKLTAADRLTYISSFSTDGMFDDIFPALFVGATICAMDIKIKNTIADVPQWLQAEEITVYHSVTTVYRYLISSLRGKEEYPCLRLIITGGEPLRTEDVRNAREYFPAVEFSNLYAMTESSVNAVRYIDTGKKVETLTMGEPVEGVEFLLLDENGEEVDEMEKGEIFIASPNIAAGYWNNPELTAKVFLHDEELGRVYRTGDQGRRHFDGTVEYLGRKDFQLKIRGYRVEPGEIENRLAMMEEIDTAVVTGVEKDGEIHLCAYIETEEPENRQEIRQRLSVELPDHMIPTYIIPMERMPLTASGKIDRRALPEPDLDTGTEYAAPRNEVEKILVDIWAGVLKIETGKIGIDHTFFELGGHSLKATTLTARIHKEMNVRVPLGQLYENPTVRAIAEYIENADRDLHEAIPAAGKRKSYPLSSAQKRLYILEKFDGAGTSYNMSTIYRIKGKLDEDVMEKALRALMRRHETLRTSIGREDEEPVQRVHKPDEVEVPLETIEMENNDSGNQQEQDTQQHIQEEIEKRIAQFLRPFELEHAPLYRVGLMKVPGETVMMFEIHHIVSDGTSMGILVDDFIRFYEGETPEPMRIQYKDYAVWQEEQREKGVHQAQEKYWMEQFGDIEELPVLDLPADRPRPPVYTFEGTRRTNAVDAGTTAGIRRLAAQTGTTLYMQMLTALNILLHRYTGQEDIVVGTGIMGRRHVDLQPVIGMFINTLAMRNRPTGEKTVNGFLEEVKNNSIKAFENQDVQFEDLVEKLNPPRDMSRNPLFDILMVVQNFEQGERRMKDVAVSFHPQERTTAKFDITMYINEAGDDIYITVEYRTSLFNGETIQRIIDHYRQVLREMVRDPETAIGDQDIVPEEEKRKILYEFNDTGAEYPAEKSIHRLIEEQVQRRPDKVAVVGMRGDDTAEITEAVTYRELNERSNRLAAELRRRGVTPETIVAIKMNRTHDLIIGIIGILKAGGAYLPIGPAIPAERMEYMLKDSQAPILLKNSEARKDERDSDNRDERSANDALNIEELNVEELNVEELNLEDLNVEPGSNDETRKSDETITSHRLCYIIYTSGSTGKPKGTLVTHRSLVNFSVWHNRHFEITENDRFTQYSEIGFDGSLLDIFPCLTAGAELNIIPDDRRLDIGWMIDYIRKSRITVSYLPTQYFQQFVEEAKHLPAMRRILTGGEKLNRYIKRDYAQNNNYGPTENTVVATTYRLGTGEHDGEHIIPIGKPVANNRVYILSKNGRQLQPIGAIGELCIAGDSLSRGYLNRPELTAEKFIEPQGTQGFGARFFPESPGPSTAKLYKTGDLARWLPDGNIDFQGRIDHQVKIRGFRIELGEIEVRLSEHPAVKEAVVVSRQDKAGTKYICAYVVPSGGEEGKPGEIDVPELRRHLAGELPAYMIPAHIVELEEMPLTASYKVNSRALPEPGYDTGGRYAAPRSEVEKTLERIWKELLGARQIGIDDNFFELGGHSLKAVSMAAKVHKAVGRKIPLAVIYGAPTIRELAKKVAQGREQTYKKITPAPEMNDYPQSPAQKRLFVLERMGNTGTTYHITRVENIKIDKDKTRLENVFKTLIQRHESLRTSFHLEKGEPVQRIHDAEEVEFKIEPLEIAGPEGVEESIKRFIRPFDLTRAPLLRVGLQETGEPGEGRYFVVDMHHIIADGVSMGILVREFLSLLTGAGQLPPLRLQYKDYSHWLNGRIKRGELERQERYWVECFAEEVPPLMLPIDKPPPSIRSFEGSKLYFQLTERQTEGLKRQARQEEAGLFMVMLAQFNQLLSRLSGREDIVVGTPVAGRSDPDLEPVIGMFVNTQAMRNAPSGEKTFREFLREVRENTLQAFENQEYPFEDLVSRVVKARDTSRNPLFDVMLVLQNNTITETGSPITQGNAEQAAEASRMEIRTVGYERTTAKFDLTLEVYEKTEPLTMAIEYGTAIFEPETVERIVTYIKTQIDSVLEAPDQKMKYHEILSDREKRQIQEEFSGPAAGTPVEKTIHTLFEEQVEKTPEHIALICGERYRYRQLNERANRVAQTLVKEGVRSNTVVALEVGRSAEQAIGILGVLKVGGVYLPIDPEYPTERIEYMKKDSNAKRHLTGRRIAEIASGGEGRRTPVNGVAVLPGDPAYVIYTSGTTGRPRGVMVEHRSAVNTLVTRKEEYGIGAGDVSLQLFSYAFDGYVTSFFTPLISGAAQVQLTDEEMKDIALIKQAVIQHRVTHFISIPVLYRGIMESLTPQEAESLKVVTLAGDMVTPYMIEQAKQKNPAMEIAVEYGVTEAAVMSTLHRRQQNETRISIGRPTANMKIQILDRHRRIQPIGVPGELLISGIGLARGYLNRPELTGEKFIASHFKAHPSPAYKTGDLARWRADGTIEFLGRIDHQVKIRGYRIELGEIESALLRCQEISEAVVTVFQKRSGQKNLCAYIVSKEPQETARLKERLAEELPVYMIPAYFMPLEKIPLTPNGKLDRKKLPEPEITAAQRYVEPKNDREKEISDIWKEVLEIDKPGAETNFFEVGGNSIDIIKINSRLKEKLGIDIPVVQMFRYPTIRTLAEYINRENKSQIVERKEEKLEGKSRMEKMRQRRRKVP